MGKFVELLAPAGNYEAFLGAICAGADAVYLGGEQFGARAYADNFDTKQIVRALHVAHFYGKKIYLTVNTLLKEKELATLCEYLSPFSEAGLDGVIVQDLGVLSYIKEHFPNLPLHASTQMTVTGKRGAAFLKEQGVRRIVPARELSLEEVRQIRETGVEVECFIHGAMCYCYSGQCLFSSILGGRSGNRGRCAQPCRLPYGVYDGKRQLLGNAYPLSLKDMCTLEYLPSLLDAGVDSLKIEGRMKRPEYTAGVTAVYRKYIDRYVKEGSSTFSVDPEDMDMLRGLYIRSEIQTGYYERHNGKEMVSLKNPGYSGGNEQLFSQIRNKYVREPEKMRVRMEASVKEGEPLELRITSESNNQISVETAGEKVQTAKNAPLQAEDIKKRLCKTGDSLLSVTDCEIHMEGSGFVPVRALNELRRQAVEAFERTVIAERGMRPPETYAESDENNRYQDKSENRLGQSTYADIKNPETAVRQEQRIIKKPAVHCLVSTLEQFRAVLESGRCHRIYMESDLFLQETEEIGKTVKDFGSGAGQAGKLPAFYLAFPYILRKRDEAYCDRLEKVLSQSPMSVSGFLVRNLESMAYVLSMMQGKEEDFAGYSVVPDAGLYCFNVETARFLSHITREITLPYELNAGEASHLVRGVREAGMGTCLIVYSRIPMMVTANCLQKTADQCSAGENGGRRIFLKDRTGASFPVAVNCAHCYNVIYNSVPYSLHGAGKERERIGADAVRYDFVTESGSGCKRILEGDFPFSEYTTGHCKRGVE